MFQAVSLRPLASLLAMVVLLAASYGKVAVSAVPHPYGVAPAPNVTPLKADTLKDLARPDVVILIRHANAPGVGDPPNIDLNVCARQRNLDQTGRDQAQALGNKWKAAGIFPTRIFTSAWCRAIETARRLEMGPTTLLPELNSFLEDPSKQAKQSAALMAFINTLDPRGGPYVMVTHQLNITALTHATVGPGEGVVIHIAQTSPGESADKIRNSSKKDEVILRIPKK